MDYTLAKQLKDAGFLQNTEKAFYLNAGKNTGALVETVMYATADREFVDAKLVAAPTLSELIEACGDSFISMDRFGITMRGVQWVCNKDKPWRSQGETAEEAVANLWLFLNKKINGS